jgi:hypothetical protein
MNFVGNFNGFRPNQGFNSGWNKSSFPFDNHQQGGNGQIFNRNEPSLRDIIRDQVKTNDGFGKRFRAIDKHLENMDAKMDSFTIAIHNQLSFNKMMETQIHQIFGALPCQSNGIPSRDPVQESVKSITTIFEGQTPESSQESLRSDEGISKVNGQETILPMSKVNNDAILNRCRNQLGRPKVPSIKCIKVHYAIYNWEQVWTS